jgi:hypothetical protein
MSDIPGYVKMTAARVLYLATTWERINRDKDDRERETRAEKIKVWLAQLPWWSPWLWWYGARRGDVTSVLDITDVAGFHTPAERACEAAGTHLYTGRSHFGLTWIARSQNLPADAEMFVAVDDVAHLLNTANGEATC